LHRLELQKKQYIFFKFKFAYMDRRLLVGAFVKWKCPSVFPFECVCPLAEEVDGVDHDDSIAGKN
jgi:hypothetical protein